MSKNIRVVIGSGGGTHNKGWLHTEEANLNLLRPEDWAKSFTPGSVQAVLAEHVWEHLDYEEGIRAAQICYPYLTPGGYIRCAVPDGYFPDEAYQKIVQIGGPGPLSHPAASHKIVHNYATLKAMFETAGYQVRLLEYCDETGEFHDNDWDETEGFIYRSKRFDHRNHDGKLGFVSLIVDAVKPQ
ncbi:class I SAM-dependent methyltransferase [Paenibacillus sp. 22594]|uniref:class I SAM-dependent methyltransferase n=1 Tax=Paenibacillus sp. 22594 TaxID=3453947 RepID=UPI003F82CA8B